MNQREGVVNMREVPEETWEEGTIFENAFATNSLCCPSRAVCNDPGLYGIMGK